MRQRRANGKRMLRTMGALSAAFTIMIGGAGVASAASWHDVTVGSYTEDGVVLRDCYHPTVQLPPSTNCTFIKRVPPGTSTHVICQRVGQDISGNNLWDYVKFADNSEGLMADYYVDTGHPVRIPGVEECR
ncbi:MAG: hypothetical protein ACRDQY_24130 [Pseudonocardiaceae bacterium]